MAAENVGRPLTPPKSTRTRPSVVVACPPPGGAGGPLGELLPDRRGPRGQPRRRRLPAGPGPQPPRRRHPRPGTRRRNRGATAGDPGLGLLKKTTAVAAGREGVETKCLVERRMGPPRSRHSVHGPPTPPLSRVPAGARRRGRGWRRVGGGAAARVLGGLRRGGGQRVAGGNKKTAPPFLQRGGWPECWEPGSTDPEPPPLGINAAPTLPPHTCRSNDARYVRTIQEHVFLMLPAETGVGSTCKGAHKGVLTAIP